MVKTIRNSENKNERMNAVYCLSLMSYNEGNFEKLSDQVEFIREKLQQDQDLLRYT